MLRRSLVLSLALTLTCGLLATSVPCAQVVAQDAAAPDPRLGALGTTLAAECYSAAGYVGALADGLNKGVYDAPYLATRLNGLNTGLTEVMRQINLVRGQVQMTPADHKALTALHKIVDGIKRQSSLLNEFAKTKDAAKAEAFRKERAATWALLIKELGISEPENYSPGGETLGK